MTKASNRSPVRALFARITGASLTQAASAPRQEARNGLRHVGSLALTKVADGLIDPKLVLSWLLSALGAPAVYVGALVPIREAGALLPQILLAGGLARMGRRKWMWAAGSAVQGSAALGIAAAGLWLDGAAAGLAICLLLAVLALARAACSVSFKDILGKTVEETRRGAVTGLAGSVASVAVVGFALLLMSGLLQDRGAVLAAIALAGIFWLMAALLFATLEEQRSHPARDRRPALLAPLRQDARLRRFVLVRGLLVSTALAPPYLVILAGGEDGAVLGRLGALVLASAFASLVSSYVWGRLADLSSRRVLAASGFGGGMAMAAMLALHGLGLGAAAWAGPVVLFVLMIAYHGVRQGRSVYLVDMAPEDARSRYTAVANTLIGGLLLVSGVFGGGLSLIGPAWALAGFAALALCGGVLALALLEEVETQG
ncbi:MFS transporter [Pseudooceanicola aestuarii]|uniref:MFS transporter n=1 Tax=Pseudooceanicola aestuarii TaxID=2697319 RepID=UPI0013D51F45|nr:MFS transporter [Pseudooceanicola aestuarii]